MAKKKNKLVPMKTSEKPQARIQIIEMTPKDAGKVPLCGHKDPSKEAYRHKFQWIKKHMSEGLKVKMLKTQDDGIAGYIEYVPGEHAWRAVNAENYMFIHCIYIQFKRCKGKGFGTLLIKECVKDAKKEDMHGVAVVTREGTWMAGKELFLKNRFEVVEMRQFRFTDGEARRFYDIHEGKPFFEDLVSYPQMLPPRRMSGIHNMQHQVGPGGLLQGGPEGGDEMVR